MALDSKKSGTIHNKTGTDLSNLKSEYDAGGIDFISEVPADSPHIASLIYQIELMQKDIDELRRYIVSNEMLSASGVGGGLPISDPRSAGTLWNNRGNISISNG